MRDEYVDSWRYPCPIELPVCFVCGPRHAAMVPRAAVEPNSFDCDSGIVQKHRAPKAIPDRILWGVACKVLREVCTLVKQKFVIPTDQNLVTMGFTEEPLQELANGLHSLAGDTVETGILNEMLLWLALPDTNSLQFNIG